MSRITGSEAKNLMEAYASVYSSQQEEVSQQQKNQEEIVEDLDIGSTRSASEIAAEKARRQSEIRSARTAKTGDIQVGTSLSSMFGGQRYKFQRDKSGNIVINDRSGRFSGPNPAERTDKTITYGGQKYDRLTTNGKLTYVKRGGATPPKPDSKPDTGAGNPPPKPDSKPDTGAGNPPPNPKVRPAGVTVKNLAGQSQQVTAGKNYAAKLGGKDVNVSYSSSGQRTITPTSSTATAKPAPTAPAQTGDKAADWEKANPRLAQASTLRQKGAPRADINKALYNKGTAAYGASGQSTMEKQASELRQARQGTAPEVKATNTAAANPNTGTTAFKPAGTPPTPTEASASAKPAPSSSSTSNQNDGKPRKDGPLWEGVDAYDIVLEYLLSNGHVDTVDEALYVMMELDGETINSMIKESSSN